MITHQKPSAWLLSLEKKVPCMFTPQGVMLALIAMYVFKVIVKVGIGGFLAGSIIVGSDGAHNISDIVEAGIVMLVVSLASRTKDSEDPFGKRNLETIFVIVIGCILGCIGASVLCASGIGIAKTWFPDLLPIQFYSSIPGFLLPETHAGDVILRGWYPTLAIITVGSIALSFTASKIQIFVGNKHGKSSIVADGIETRSDGIVESITLIGISGEYFFQDPSIEFYFGVLAGGFILHIAYGLGKHGIGVLLQKSLPSELKRAIQKNAEGMHGVISATDLKMFPVGSAAIVMMKITTACTAEMNVAIKKVLVENIARILEQSGFLEYGCYIRMVPPDKDAHRIAYLLIRDKSGTACVSSYISTATHVRIVDVENGMPVRSRDYPIPTDLPTFLREKCVRLTHLRFSHHNKPMAQPGITWVETAIADPRELRIA